MYSNAFVAVSWELAHSKGIGYFSSVGHNPKTLKSDKKTDYLTLLQYLAPSDQAGRGFNVCASASPGCRRACLFTSGRGRYDNVQRARKLRTRFWFEHRENMKACLFDEIRDHVRLCEELDKLPAVRLNGTSDIPWEVVWPKIFEEFPQVSYYDYTKHWRRLMPTWRLPKNYHLTFSLSETNLEYAEKIMAVNKQANIAVVFKDELPDKWHGRKVINGDNHDCRLLDGKGVIVGLLAKGRAKSDTSGFVIQSHVACKNRELELVA